MHRKLAALAALALAHAAASAQPVTDAAVGAAPAPAYVSPCKRPAIEPYPPLPNAATAKAAEVSTAVAQYQVWSAPIPVYQACVKKELARLDAEIKATGAASSGPAKLVTDYDQLLDVFTRGLEATKAGGIEPALINVKLIAAGKTCPNAPPATEAPTPPAGPLSKSQTTAANKAFSSWAGPIYVYLKCVEADVPAARAELDKAANSIVGQRNRLSQEYNEVTRQAFAFNQKWTAFATAYNAR